MNARVKSVQYKLEQMLRDRKNKTLGKGLIEFETDGIDECITPYQFKDFMSLLRLYKLCGEGVELTSEGKIFVASNFLLYRFILSDFENTLRKGNSMETGSAAGIIVGEPKKGYLYDPEGGIFLWELGCDTEYPVYIRAKWEGSQQEHTPDDGRLNRIRIVMQYYWMLNIFVFNKSNEGLFGGDLPLQEEEKQGISPCYNDGQLYWDESQIGQAVGDEMGVLTYKSQIYDVLRDKTGHEGDYLDRNYYSERGIIVRKSNAPYEFS